MERPALLAIVRHAESKRNAVKRGNVYFADDEMREHVRGIPDYEIPITERGALQAEAMGKMLRERFGIFDYAYHSGYRRTIETLEGIFRAWPDDERDRIAIRPNLFIRERDPGWAYDMTEYEVESAFPWLKEYWATSGGFFAQPPGGESLAQVCERVYLFLNMLFRDRAGQRILVVTHGGTMRCVRVLLERWTYEQALAWPAGQSPKNCGLLLYEYDSGESRLILREYNTVAYGDALSS